MEEAHSVRVGKEHLYLETLSVVSLDMKSAMVHYDSQACFTQLLLAAENKRIAGNPQLAAEQEGTREQEEQSIVTAGQQRAYQAERHRLLQEQLKAVAKQKKLTIVAEQGGLATIAEQERLAVAEPSQQSQLYMLS